MTALPIRWPSVDVWRFEQLPAMDLPDRDGLIAADSPRHVLEAGGLAAAVEVDFIVLPPEDLVPRALRAVELPDVGTVTIHHRKTPHEQTVLAYALAQRLRVLSRSLGLVMVGVEPDDPEATAHGRRVTPHRIELRTAGGSWVERRVWEIISPARYTAWSKTRTALIDDV